MNKLYREVSVIDRLPQTEGRYLVKSHGEWFSASYLEQFSFHEEMLDCSGVTHWLEEVELPTITVIRNTAMENKDIAGYFEELAFETGANYILNKLKGVKDE